MPPPDVDITVVWVSYFSTPYLEHLHDNLLAKASGLNKIRFLLVDNADGRDEAIRAFAAAHTDIDLHTVPPHGKVGSWGHAAGLDYAMQHLGSPYTLICDPDIHLFVQSWDRYMIDVLRAECLAVLFQLYTLAGSCASMKVQGPHVDRS